MVGYSLVIAEWLAVLYSFDIGCSTDQLRSVTDFMWCSVGQNVPICLFLLFHFVKRFGH